MAQGVWRGGQVGKTGGRALTLSSEPGLCILGRAGPVQGYRQAVDPGVAVARESRSAGMSRRSRSERQD